MEKSRRVLLFLPSLLLLVLLRLLLLLLAMLPHFPTVLLLILSCCCRMHRTQTCRTRQRLKESIGQRGRRKSYSDKRRGPIRQETNKAEAHRLVPSTAAWRLEASSLPDLHPCPPTPPALLERPEGVRIGPEERQRLSPRGGGGETEKSESNTTLVCTSCAATPVSEFDCCCVISV